MSMAEARVSQQTGKQDTSQSMLKWVWCSLLLGGLLGLAFLPLDLQVDGRLSLITFIVAIYCWTATSLPTSWVAVAALLFLVMSGATNQNALFSSLSSDVIWLMIGAFMIGAAMQKTGLAARVTLLLTSRAKTVPGLFLLLTLVIQFLTLLIPSTSGRASVLIPIFRDLSEEVQHEKVTKGLSLLIPTIILIATSSTLLGASSHFIVNNYLRSLGEEEISFLTWMVWGAPFALVASICACTVIIARYLDREARGISLSPKQMAPAGELTQQESITSMVLGAMVLLWTTESIHGIDMVTVTIYGALLLTAPKVGSLPWKEGIQSVPWNLILFVAAAIALGDSLTETGAADWLVGNLLAITKSFLFQSEFMTLLLVTVICLSAHLYLPSHTTRAIIFTPPLLSLGLAEGIDVVSMSFLMMVGMNYCLTFPVSSKALMIYFDENKSFRGDDLRRLSQVMSIIYLGLMILFYYTYWEWTGLTL